MPIIARDNGNVEFERAEVGNSQAVCSHVIDLGIQETQYGKKLQVSICFELDQKMKDGRPFMLLKTYTNSLNEKATLRHDLENWRGKKFDEQELQGFDLEKLIGVNCTINVVEAIVGNKVYSNISSITPMMRGMTKITPTGQQAPEWIMKKKNAQLSPDNNDQNDFQDSVAQSQDDLPF